MFFSLTGSSSFDRYRQMKLVWTVVKMLENVIENKQVENSNYKTIKLLISTETFNYHSLPLDLDIEQKFNVRRCFANDQDSIPITVTISLKNTFGGVLKKYNTQGNILFKNNLKQMLAEIGECSSMQLTDFNYNHDLETIDVDVTLRNIQKVQGKC